MMNILKYCVNGKKTPIIFSYDIIHCDVMPDAISAGFLIVKFDLIRSKFSVKCFGESSSLKIKTADYDEELIENYLNNEFHSSVLKCKLVKSYNNVKYIIGING
jgi:hypothetical protein